MKSQLHHLSALVGLSLLMLLSLNAQSAGLPLMGKNGGDVRVDLPGHPLSFRLLDKEGTVRFQVVSSGRAIATAAQGSKQASTTIIVASIHEQEWQLHTYKRFSKPALRLFPIELESGTVLRVWTKSDEFFDIDLDFGGKLEFQPMKIAEQDGGEKGE